MTLHQAFEASLRAMYRVPPEPGSACYEQMRKRWNDCAAGLPYDKTVTQEIVTQLAVEP